MIGLFCLTDTKVVKTVLLSFKSCSSPEGFGIAERHLEIGCIKSSIQTKKVSWKDSLFAVFWLDLLSFVNGFVRILESFGNQISFFQDLESFGKIIF